MCSRGGPTSSVRQVKVPTAAIAPTTSTEATADGWASVPASAARAMASATPACSRARRRYGSLCPYSPDSAPRLATIP